MECEKHDFEYLGGMSNKGILFLVLWDLALFLIIAYTLMEFQFYWIVLILFFASTFKPNKTIYCKNCGLIKKEED